MTAPFAPFRPLGQAATLAGVAALFCLGAAQAKGEDTYQRVFGPAIDWSVLARLSESVQLDSNRRLNGDNEGIEAAGTVGLGVTVAGRGKRTRFSVATNLALGRSTDNTVGNLDRLDPNIAATAVFLGKGYSVNTSLNAQSRAVSVSELEDTGVTNLNATRFDLSGSVGVSWNATKRDSLSLGASVQLVDFNRSIGTLSPSRTFGVNGGWSRQVSPTTSVSASTSLSHFEATGATGRTSRNASIRLGIQHQRTPRHNLGASAGFSFVSSDRDNGPSTTQVGFVGGGTFGYRIDEFAATLNLNQSIQPSADGDLNAFTSLRGSLAYRVNALQNLSFGVTYTRRSEISGGGDVLQFLSLGPSYSYSLSEDSSLSLGYQFRLRDDPTNDLEAGHQVMLTLSHQFDLLQ